MKNLIGLILIAICTLPISAAERVINIEVQADYLESDSQGSFLKWGKEIHFGPIDWLSETEGQTSARMWNTPALIDFQLTNDKKTVRCLSFNPKPGAQENLWELWRQRHAYTFIPSHGYGWRTLGDAVLPMDYETGQFYDQVLKELWSYWIIKRIPEQLPQTQDISVLKKSVQIRTDETGRMEPTQLNFHLSLWHMPVKISFDVASSTQPGHKSTTLQLLGKYRWKYDAEEWRERYGYRKDIWGDYGVVPGWPEKRRLSKQQGKVLDDLIDRTVTHWVETSIQKIMVDLQAKFMLDPH